MRTSAGDRALCFVVEVCETDVNCYKALKSQLLYNSAYNVASRISTTLMILSAYILVGQNPLKIHCSKSISQIHSNQHLINVVGYHLPLSEPTCLAMQLQRSLTSQGLKTHDSDGACCQPEPQLLFFTFSHKPHLNEICSIPFFKSMYMTFIFFLFRSIIFFLDPLF